MKGKRIYLSAGDRQVLEDTLCRALRVAQTEVALTHPSNPVHDAYSHSQARIECLLARVRS